MSRRAAIVDSLNACREIVAAGLTSPALVSLTLQKMIPPQRNALEAFSSELGNVLKNCNSVRAYREAILGIQDAPDPQERYPKAAIVGFIHGDSSLLLSFLDMHSDVEEFLSEAFKNDALVEAMCTANMSWVSQHPNDYEASIRSAASMRMTHKKKDVQEKMKHLLLLNLQLHFPSETWLNIIRVRDSVVDLLVRAVNNIPRCTPDVDRALREAEVAATSLCMLKILSSPDEVKTAIVSVTVKCIGLLAPLVHDSENEEASLADRLSAQGVQQRSVSMMLRKLMDNLSDEISLLSDCS